MVLTIHQSGHDHTQQQSCDGGWIFQKSLVQPQEQRSEEQEWRIWQGQKSVGIHQGKREYQQKKVDHVIFLFWIVDQEPKQYISAY
jgi:hypothetical protein